MDAQTIIRATNQAEDVHAILIGMSRVKRRAEQLGIQDGSVPGVPVNLDLLDQADQIRSSIVGWAQLLHEEHGDPLPASNVPAWTLFLREHAIWITGAPWAEDMLAELRDRTSRGIAMLGLYPKRTQLPDHCQCGAPQWVYHEDVAWTQCADGHVASLAEALPANTRTLSCSEAAMILGVTTRTIERWVEDRKIAAASHNPTRISALAVKMHRAGLAERSHVA